MLAPCERRGSRPLNCSAFARLTKLDLDWDLTNDFTIDYETPAWAGTNKDTDTDADIDTGSGTCNVLNTIERWASPHLEYLVLRPHPSIGVLEKDMRSLLRTRTSLRTVKLYDVDVKEDVVRRQKRRSGKERRPRRKGHHNKERDADAAQQTMEGLFLGSRKTAVSSSSPSPSIGTSLSEAESVSSLEQQFVKDDFRLEFLYIDSSTITTLAHLLQGCTHLRVLHLHRCDYLKDAALEAIAQHAPSMMSIALTNCRQLTAAGLGQFLKTKAGTRRLEHVHFQDIPALDDDTLRILATYHGQSLRKLTIFYSFQVSDRGLQALLSVATGLKILSLQSHQMTLAVFSKPWACCSTLEFLELYGHFSRPQRCEDVSANPLRKPDPFTTLKSRIMTLSRLKELRLSATDIGKDLLEGFGETLRIERLGLYDMEKSETFSLEWATLPMRFPHLKKLLCVFWCQQGHFRNLLAPFNIEVCRAYKIPKLASDNDFDEASCDDLY
ncbi:unnamed protein product [Mortierella alpina]